MKNSLKLPEIVTPDKHNRMSKEKGVKKLESTGSPREDDLITTMKSRKTGLALLTEIDSVTEKRNLNKSSAMLYRNYVDGSKNSRLKTDQTSTERSFRTSVNYPEYLHSLQENYDRFMYKTNNKLNIYKTPPGVYPDPHHINEFYRVDIKEYAKNMRGYVSDLL